MYSVTEQFVAWLENAGYEASTYPSATAATEFVTVERTGGNVEDLVDHPTVAIQTWADTEARAEEMAVGIRNLLVTTSRPYGIAKGTVNSGPYPFWDESTGKPRYQTVFDCTAQLTD